MRLGGGKKMHNSGAREVCLSMFLHATQLALYRTLWLRVEHDRDDMLPAAVLPDTVARR